MGFPPFLIYLLSIRLRLILTAVIDMKKLAMAGLMIPGFSSLERLHNTYICIMCLTSRYYGSKQVEQINFPSMEANFPYVQVIEPE